MPQAKTILEHPTVQRARLRAKCERAVDRLLAVLDLIDGDPDAEPSLGFAEPRQNPHAYGALDQTHIAEGATDDREDEHDGREPDEDAEDTLGRTEAIDQSRRQVGADDLEPSLGSPPPSNPRRILPTAAGKAKRGARARPCSRRYG